MNPLKHLKDIKFPEKFHKRREADGSEVSEEVKASEDSEAPEEVKESEEVKTSEESETPEVVIESEEAKASEESEGPEGVKASEESEESEASEDVKTPEEHKAFETSGASGISKTFKNSKVIRTLKALKGLKEFDSIKNLKLVKTLDSLSDKTAGLRRMAPQILQRSFPHVLVMALAIALVTPMDMAAGVMKEGSSSLEERITDGAVSGGADAEAAAADRAADGSGNEGEDKATEEDQEGDSKSRDNKTTGMSREQSARSGAFIPGRTGAGSVSGDGIAEWNAAFDMSEYAPVIIANRRELARRIWSVMSSFKEVKNGGKTPVYYGLRGEQICALLGNWEQESGLDPTAVEAVFYEPWMIGVTKNEAIRHSFITEHYWGTDEINGYFDRHSDIYKAGIGLAQWTDTYSGTYSLEPETDETDEDIRAAAAGESSKVTYDRKRSDLDVADGHVIIDDNSEIIRGSDEIGADDEKDVALYENDDDTDAGYEQPQRNTGRSRTRRSPGRNSKLTEYAQKTGLKLYNGINKDAAVWDCDEWIESTDSVRGTWCDPLVQLAFALDESQLGDSRAAWLNEWAECGEQIWKGDRTVDLGELSDSSLEGWTWMDKEAFTPEHGWDPSLFYVTDNAVEFTSDEDTISPSGDNTEDRIEFRSADTHLRKGVCNDSYYNTPNDDYVASIMYDRWDWEDGKALSTSGDDWDLADRDEAQESNVNAARRLAFEYAEKSAGLAWHGRIDGRHGVLGSDPDWNDYSRAAGRDFICENNASTIFIMENGYEKDGPYQHYGLISDDISYDEDGNEMHDYKYGWIMDGDPTLTANYRAMSQYKHLFKYIYRYHLYRYMTLYYTTQFLAEYEGVPGKALEERQKNALGWFQMWWDSALTGGKAEPNVYAQETETVNSKGEKEKFFEVQPEYAQSITENINPSKDTP